MGAIFAGLLRILSPLAARATMVGLGIALLSGGALYAGCQVKSCMRMKEELREYHRADEIRKEDPKVDQRTEEHKKKVEEFSTPGDFKRGFDELRHYRADD
jgi:hypothetical protein